jgi:hypothetical protein
MYSCFVYVVEKARAGLLSVTLALSPVRTCQTHMLLQTRAYFDFTFFLKHNSLYRFRFRALDRVADSTVSIHWVSRNKTTFASKFDV